MTRPLLPALLLSVTAIATFAAAPSMRAAATPRPQAAPPAVETARALQQKYDQVKDFTADFTHTYEGGVLKRKSTERGTVQIKKPGKMRWEYTAPEKKTFVSDGSKIYSHIPADKQAIVSDVPRDGEATTAVLFLAGKGNLTRDFDVTYTEGGGAGTWALRLDPKQTQRDYDWLILVVDRASMQIRGLTAADQQGGRSTFQFTSYRENTGIADSVFIFRIPKGTDVIKAGPGR